MSINKILIVSAIALLFLADNTVLEGETGPNDYTGESILYVISPFGKAEYNDLGVVDLNGTKANLVTFKAKALLAEDTQKIYSDPESFLPYKIEHTISKLWGRQLTIEEYDQENFTVVIKKFKGEKLADQQVIKTTGPIQSEILLPFYLRRGPDLAIGWQFTARVPAEYKLELVSIDAITIPAGTFQAYHFKSNPDKFEIWINKDAPRVPLKIQAKGIFTYALLMKEYIRRNK